MSRFYSRMIATIVLLILLIVWECVGSDKWGTPSAILSTLLAWVQEGYLWPHLWATFKIALAGLFFGLILGMSLGYLFFKLTFLDEAFTPAVMWLNALPRILLVPLLIALMGIGASAKLVMVIAMTFFLFFFSTLNGLKSVDNRIVLNARLLGAGEYAVVRHVYLPFINTWILTSMRPAVGFALIGAIISEYLGATAGMGYVVDIAYGSDRYDRAFAGILVIFVIAALLDYIVRLCEQLLADN